MRISNPFARKTAQPSSAAAPADTPTVDATAVLGEPLAAKLAATVRREPGILDVVASTASAVQPEDVDDPTVTVLSILFDNTTSAHKYQSIIGLSHDVLIDALKPAQHEGVTILVTCSTMTEGEVVYPLTRLDDVKPFGLPAEGTVREIRQADETITVDSRGYRVYENGLTYDHMTRRFRLIPHTPLRDRVKEQLVALMAELLRWENPMVARKVNVISSVLTDGLDTSSETPVSELAALVEEIEGGGSLTEVATFIGDVKTRDFRSTLLRNIVGNLIPERERHNVSRDRWVEVFGERVLPEGHADMDNETLLRWWFFEQGLAAMEDRLWLPGTDPKAIRRAVNQMSQTAGQASVGAFRKDGDEEADEPASVTAE